MNEFIEQKKKEYQRFLKEATHIEVGSQLEIQLTSQLENYITESYNKGVEDAIKKIDERLKEAEETVGWGGDDFLTIIRGQITVLEKIRSELEQLKKEQQ